MKHSLTVLASVLAGTLAVSCATRHHRHEPPPRDPPPPWTQCAKPNDSVSLYRVGTATDAPTAAAAREAAYQDAVRQITQAILLELRGSAAGNRPLDVPLNGAEILPGCSYTVRTPSGYDGWVQVSYPLAEKSQLVESLKSDRRPPGR